jgi:hypothetical protein
MAATVTRAAARAAVLRGCTSKDITEVILYGIAVADRVQLTRSGIRFYGPKGTAGTHFTPSDRRARDNLISDLRKAGL